MVLTVHNIRAIIIRELESKGFELNHEGDTYVLFNEDTTVDLTTLDDILTVSVY